LIGAGFALDAGSDDSGVAQWLWSMLTVLGALCYLLAGATLAGVPSPSLLHVMLSSSVPRYIGRVSYNLYLWHWPAILVGRYLVFAPSSPIRHLGDAPRTAVGVALCLLLGVGVPILSYHVVEAPLRAWKPVRPSRVVLAMLLLIGGAEGLLSVLRLQPAGGRRSSAVREGCAGGCARVLPPQRGASCARLCRVARLLEARAGAALRAGTSGRKRRQRQHNQPVPLPLLRRGRRNATTPASGHHQQQQQQHKREPLLLELPAGTF
jgi:hypothetical protein